MPYATKEDNAAAQRRWRERNRQKDRDSTRDSRLRRLYGMTSADKQNMLDAQGGVCGLCGIGRPGNDHTGWHVDHCHESGEVRSVLCHNCNCGLGHFKDDPDLLRRAIEYLERKNNHAFYSR